MHVKKAENQPVETTVHRTVRPNAHEHCMRFVVSLKRYLAVDRDARVQHVIQVHCQIDVA